MNMKKNKGLQIGVGLFALSLVLSRFFVVSDMLIGFLTGLGLSFILIHIIPPTFTEKLKSWKSSLLK